MSGAGSRPSRARRCARASSFPGPAARRGARGRALPSCSSPPRRRSKAARVSFPGRRTRKATSGAAPARTPLPAARWARRRSGGRFQWPWSAIILRSLDRLRALAQDLQVGIVDIEFLAFAPGAFAHNAEFRKMIYSCGHRRLRQADELGRTGNGKYDSLLERVVQAQRRGRSPPQLFDAGAIVPEQFQDALRRARRLLGGVDDGRQEKMQPRLPCALDSYPLQQIVVGIPALLEIQAQIEYRLCQSPFSAHEQSDEQAPDPAVAVEKGMDGLELHVGKRRFDKKRRLHGVVVKKFFERAHELHDFVRWRRHKRRVAGARSANPVLGSPEFPRCFGASPPFRQENPVYFLEEPQRQGKTS